MFPFDAQIMTNFTYHVRSKRIKIISSSNAKDASDGAVESVHVIQSESFLLFRLRKKGEFNYCSQNATNN